VGQEVSGIMVRKGGKRPLPFLLATWGVGFLGCVWLYCVTKIRDGYGVLLTGS
jgi:hypothetical protein